MRFELIDRVIERQSDRLVAVKCVSRAEEYLADHFPGFPVLPGVLMLESLVQAGRVLAGEADDQDGPLVLAEARNVRYGNMVRPGQALTVEVKRRGLTDQDWQFDGVGKVEGRVVVQARFRLAPLHRVLS